MAAGLTVSADAGGEGDGGGAVPGIPENARVLGIVVAPALVSIVALTYFFLKYGGDYDPE